MKFELGSNLIKHNDGLIGIADFSHPLVGGLCYSMRGIVGYFGEFENSYRNECFNIMFATANLNLPVPILDVEGQIKSVIVEQDIWECPRQCQEPDEYDLCLDGCKLQHDNPRVKVIDEKGYVVVKDVFYE